MPPTGQRLEAHPTFRYMVKIDGIEHAVFAECRLPSFQVETLEIREGGQNNYTHQLPVRVKGGSITLKYGITKNDALLNWYLEVLEILMHGKLQSVTRSVNVTMYAVDRSKVAVFSLEDAYPKKWSGPTLKADDRAIAVEELELGFTQFSVTYS